MKQSTAAAALVVATLTGFEGVRYVAYKDSVGIPTICMGETKNVRMGMTATPAECDKALIERANEFAAGVESCVPSAKDMPVERYAAHVSLAYNIGTSAYCKSSIARLTNAGDVRGGCNAFLLYVKAGGITLKGLVNRRNEERRMCLKGL
ncbi:lysozyme [Enterovirga sp. DB1703]|uniref:Lysozyme n=1 Tax=Enterovirga aerilata TaxID=2730920 RepID=A0A849IBG7_9HYPH|nr:lysozyme [Enterovirga sp. DB1703]